VTTAAAMPDLVGMSASEAESELEQLGARVQTVARYVRDTPPGQVLEVEPADGAVPVEVTLTVSAPAASVQLSTLRPLRTDCSVADADVNGEEYTAAVLCGVANSTRTPPISTEYDISRDADRVSFSAGLRDDSDLTAVANVAVLLDGVAVAAQQVGFGQLVEFDLDTAGKLRLTIVVTGTVEQQPRATVAIVDALVSGGREAIDELADQP
jgi:hypothetical protein